MQGQDRIATLTMAAMGPKAFDRRAPLWQATLLLQFHSLKGTTMPKEEWGTKRICPTTGKR
ncbi:MAG: FYDLN acid domain-containing protein, partial [Paracoccaceae bacterium]